MRICIIVVAVMMSPAVGAEHLSRLERARVTRVARALSPGVSDATLVRILDDVARIEVGAKGSNPDRTVNQLASRASVDLRRVLSAARAGTDVDPALLRAILLDLFLVHRLAAHRAWTHEDQVRGTNDVLTAAGRIAFVGLIAQIAFDGAAPPQLPIAVLALDGIYTLARLTRRYRWLPILPGVDSILNRRRARRLLPAVYEKLARGVSDEPLPPERDPGDAAVLSDVRLILRRVWGAAAVDAACANLLATEVGL